MIDMNQIRNNNGLPLKRRYRVRFTWYDWNPRSGARYELGSLYRMCKESELTGGIMIADMLRARAAWRASGGDADAYSEYEIIEEVTVKDFRNENAML